MTGTITWKQFIPSKQLIGSGYPGAYSGGETTTGTFNVDLTDNGISWESSSTYSITNTVDATYPYYNGNYSQPCTITDKGSFSGSGSLLLPGNGSGTGGIALIFDPPRDPYIGIIISVGIAEAETSTDSCTGDVETYSETRPANPECLDKQKNNPGGYYLWGDFAGTYPNGKVDLGCSGTDPSSGITYTVTGILTVSGCGGTSALSPKGNRLTTAAYVEGSSSGGVCEHYTIEIRAWIPFQHVVDPMEPTATPYLVSNALPLNCNPNPAPGDKLHTWVTSTLRGDGHAGFSGSYRLAEAIQFNFDGQKISDFSEVAGFPHVGASHRDETFYTGPVSNGHVMGTCTHTETAANGSSAAQTGDTTFVLSYEQGLPLIPGSPDVYQVVRGTVNQDGSINLSYTATNFPNQAIQVTHNGAVILTAGTNDVTCFASNEVLGGKGAAIVFFGLNTTHSGSYHADPAAPASYDQPSALCSGIWRK